MSGDLAALAATAARVMPGWATDHTEHGAYLSGPGGARLHFHEQWNRKGNVTVSGCYPRTSGRTDHASITVRMDRGAGVLAREIKRRLLPGYLACLAKVAERNAAEQHDTGLRLALADKIAGMFGESAHMPDRCQSDYQTQVVVSLGDLRGGWVKMHGDGSEVELERFRVPAEVAVRMLALFADELTEPS